MKPIVLASIGATFLLGAGVTSVYAQFTTSLTGVRLVADQVAAKASNQSTHKKAWKSPRMHGRGANDLALIVMNGKPQPQATTPNAANPKAVPGMDWKPKAQTRQRPPRGTRTLPGMIWRPKTNKPSAPAT